MRKLLIGSRLFLVSIWVIITSIVFITVAIIRGTKKTTNGGLFAKYSFPMVFKLLGIRLVIQNREKTLPNESYVIVGNHQHNLDFFTYGYVSPLNIAAIGKKEMLFIPVLGALFYFCGQILIDRKNKASAKKTLDDCVKRLKLKELTVMIFPEGTRSHGKGLGPFKKGAFHMAVNAQVPILIIVESDYFKYVDIGRWRSGTILMNVLDPIPTKGLTLEDIPKLMEITRSKMQEGIEKINQIVEKEFK